jgi:hypothetical protein
MRGLREEIAASAARRFLEKRGFARALGVGLSLPETMERAHARHDQILHDVNAASNQNAGAGIKRAAAPPAGHGGGGGGGGKGGPPSLMSPMSALNQLLGAPVAGVSGAIEQGIKNRLTPKSFGEHKDPMHMMASSAMSSFGGALGAAGVDLIKDMAAKAMAAAGHAGDAAARTAILQQLKKTDPVLAQADDKVLMESFHTMSRFAPVLSTDKNMVRSFLRQAVMSGSGPDFTTVKLLADSERAVTGERGR